MNELTAPMPRMQPAMQAALVPSAGGQSQPQSAPPQGQPMPQNALQAPPQATPGGPSTPGPGIIQAPPSISPEQIQQYHDHAADMQQTLHGLLKLPDNELNTKSIFRAAADMVTKHQLHGGRKGIPAAAIASELSSPDFPKASPNGEPPSPEAIRNYLQNHFDQTVLSQAKITQKFGPSIPHVPNQDSTM